jgi:hypothetical protein
MSSARQVWRVLAVVLAASAPGLAHAAEDGGGEDAIAEAAEEELASGWSWFGDALLRGDQVRNLTGRDDLERVRGRLRLGIRYDTGAWQFGAAVEGTHGSDDDRDNVRNNDNEESDDLELDRLYARWQPGEDTWALLGKSAFPLTLTPMVWDQDLRPVGASASHRWAAGESGHVGVTGGYFAGDHLYGDDSRLAAAQLFWLFDEGGPWAGDLLLSFLYFDDLDRLTEKRVTRTNRRIGNRLVSDYELADLQLGVRFGAGDLPLELRVDLVHNLGADDQNDGARASLVLGSSRLPGGWELGYAQQRIQRDAVMAAFNSDDWWIHSVVRGGMLWLGYGFSERVSGQVSAFSERRDDQTQTVHRVLVDLRARW